MRIRVITAAVLAATLSACGGQAAGSAALVGDTRITEAALGAEVGEVLTAQGRAPEEVAPTVMAATLGRWITVELVNQLAGELGIEVTQGEIDSVMGLYAAQAGGPEALAQSLLDQDIAPDEIESVVRLNLQAEKISVAIAPDQPPDVQSMAVFQAVTQYADQVGVEVSPRYGTWDGPNLAIGPPPADLSTAR